MALDSWIINADGIPERVRDGLLGTREATGAGVWWGHHDYRDRGAPHPGTGFAPFDAYLSDELTAPKPDPVGAILHLYSGSSYPASFAASAVSDAPGLGAAAMLNTKVTDWAGLANGDYDADLTNLFQTWPVDLPGNVTLNHEPENDGPTPANPSNPSYVSWAEVNGPIFCDGIRHWIDLVAPIIRSRGLDVKIGGCLMGFSWDSTRWEYWKWWEGITPTNLGEVDFGVDAYAKTDVVSGDPVGHSLLPRINEVLVPMRAAGIGSMSIYETAVSIYERNNGDVVVGNDDSNAAWWDQFYRDMQAIPETRMVCYFHIPTGPASAAAYLENAALTKFAEICAQGRRP